jgi:hypothetical protein
MIERLGVEEVGLVEEESGCTRSLPRSCTCELIA